ncbi:ribonuclease E inhibitor RraB [Glaesserella parasuis]|uniref:Regulator of ribonuclease activity B n=3 Tax=Glaesserella parasuis TaxID=738 RepID=A0A836MFU2_GLAPU|nr:ribonuclease E inhibitor RraB [Glaesserella parasuis]EQA04699.1 regulator of ribonuclease activity B [Glaesserella parasuis 12939]EQA12077.1 regulator of ribonuclease activity B [Glaesserella parasuis SW140]AMW16202.1 RNase E inhibitor protein [Glaesserella parasuis]ATW46004.1 ribonuclease E inhibitor B [Glaesserella parasuis str. Nagasaki]AWY46100.1 ribonuclease E inhibitor RraB [Glaesserella parasuis 29755]
MYNLTELRQETDEIIKSLLDDGSDPEALYIIEHHVAHHDFDKLEKLVVDAYKLGYEISEAEEVEEENGDLVFVCDIVSEIKLDAELITAQQKELLPLIEKSGAVYEGWGTYFEDPNSDEDEYGDDGEFFDDEDDDFDDERR